MEVYLKILPSIVCIVTTVSDKRVHQCVDMCTSSPISLEECLTMYG